MSVPGDYLRRLKRASLQTIHSVGGFNLLLDSAWRRKRLLILCYHGVSIADEHEWHPALYMPPAALRARLEILRTSRCTVLPLGDAVARLYAGTLPDRSVVLTFDDGYVDFREQAYPLLREYDIPATVYLTTLRCGCNRPIFRLIASYMLWKARGRVVDFGSEIGDGPTRFDLRTDDGRTKALQAVLAASDRQRLDMEGKHRLAACIGSWIGVDYDDLAARRLLTIMSPDEVRLLSAAGVDFQLHTHTHTTPTDVDRFEREIVRNREAIEAMTGQPASHFCYPSGYYRPEFLPWLSDGRIVSATTCDPGLASERSNPLLLPRFVDVISVSPIEFQGWLSGAASLISRRKSYGTSATAARMPHA
jgi:peptidoglycan/xylan/chitin deacetylase (PgdA/CDA1 family)